MKGKIGIIVGVVLACILLGFGLSCCQTVGPTERGVMVTLGKVGTDIMEPGLHTKMPWQTIKTYDLTPVEYEKSFSCGSDGAISKDMQTIGLTFTLYWKYDSTRLLEVAENYKSTDSIYQPISTAVKAAIKNQVGKYSVEEIVANQATLTTDVRNEFVEQISYLPIVVTDFKIGNFDWSEDYDAMIRKTMTRKQEVEQMKQEVALAEQEAQKQVKESQAKLDAQKLDSEAAVVKAKGEADAVKAAADAELYEAQQIARAAEMKRAQWAHEEKMAELKAWNGKKVSDVMVMTPSGTLTSVNGK